MIKSKNPTQSFRRQMPKLEWLPLVRMLVVSFIIFGYASTMPRGPDKAEYLRLFGYDPSWYGITLLFMISGFLAARSLQRDNSAFKFLISRTIRNVPTLIVFALLVIFVLFPVFGEGNAQSPIQHLRYFFNVVSCVNPGALTPGLLDDALYMCAIHGGLWTFRWGAIAYLGTAIMWRIGLFKSNRILLFFCAALIALFCALASYNVAKPSTALEGAQTALHLAWPYIAGMCAYRYQNKIPRLIMIPAAFIFVAGIHYLVLPWTPYIEVLMDIGLGLLVFQAITNPASCPGWLRKLPDLSLGLYVFNWPVLQITLLLLPGLSPLLLFAIGFPITILIAFMNWALVQKPTRKYFPRPARIS